MVKGPSRLRGIPGKVISIQQQKSKRTSVSERWIGRFNNIEAAWDRIVDLYHTGKISWIVFVPRHIYDSEPLLKGHQYEFNPGDIIGPRSAIPIDHGGWAPIPVKKDSIHFTLQFPVTSHQGPVELFVDKWKKETVAKVVPVTDS